MTSGLGPAHESQGVKKVYECPMESCKEGESVRGDIIPICPQHMIQMELSKPEI